MAAWQRTLEELIDTRRSALVGYAFMLTGNVGDAEDLVHEAVLRTFASSRDLTSVGHAEGYVRKAIMTTFLNTRRRHRTFVSKVHLFVATNTVSDIEDRVGDTDAVRLALGALSPRQRACIVLRYFDDLSVRDVAQTLDLSEGAVKRYLSDAVAALTVRLGPDALGEPHLESNSGPAVSVSQHRTRRNR